MAKSLRGKISLPGDKSISHRALILAAISEGRCNLDNLAQSLDVESTLNCLRQLGVNILRDDRSAQVNGVGFRNFRRPDAPLDCGNSGTTLRLLMGLLSGSNVVATLDGDRSLRRRPVKRVMEPLKKMGAKLQTASGSDNCPVVISGQRLKGGSQRLNVPSAQVKTAVLLGGLLADGITELEEIAKTRDHTERMLDHLGIDVEVQHQKIRLTAPKSIEAFDLLIPGDPSSAAFPVVAATLMPESNLLISKLLLNPTRIGFIQILKGMGADVSLANVEEKYREPIGDLRVRSSGIRAVNVDADRAPSYIDEVPILALAATQAGGRSVFRGLAELKVKECNRLEGIKNILNEMGGRAIICGDDLIVEGPTPMHKYQGESPCDHRLAMMIEVGNMVSNGKMICKYESVINVSFKEFYPMMKEVLE